MRDMPQLLVYLVAGEPNRCQSLPQMLASFSATSPHPGYRSLLLCPASCLLHEVGCCSRALPQTCKSPPPIKPLMFLSQNPSSFLGLEAEKVQAFRPVGYSPTLVLHFGLGVPSITISLSTVLTRILLNQFRETPQPFIADQIPHS